MINTIIINQKTKTLKGVRRFVILLIYTCDDQIKGDVESKIELVILPVHFLDKSYKEMITGKHIYGWGRMRIERIYLNNCESIPSPASDPALYKYIDVNIS